jgi:hypothetical protein
VECGAGPECGVGGPPTVAPGVDGGASRPEPADEPGDQEVGTGQQQRQLFWRQARVVSCWQVGQCRLPKVGVLSAFAEAGELEVLTHALAQLGGAGGGHEQLLSWIGIVSRSAK